MAFELATVLLGACIGAMAVLYAAPKGYLGHKRIKYTPTTTSIEPFVAPAPEPVPEVKAAEPEPAPAPAPVTTAIYETVQPAPAPVTYAVPAPASFSARTFAKKPVRTYRRRTAPVRSTAASKVTKAKTKKR